jgi:hypothetical protein
MDPNLPTGCDLYGQLGVVVTGGAVVVVVGGAVVVVGGGAVVVVVVGAVVVVGGVVVVVAGLVVDVVVVEVVEVLVVVAGGESSSPSLSASAATTPMRMTANTTSAPITHFMALDMPPLSSSAPGGGPDAPALPPPPAPAATAAPPAAPAAPAAGMAIVWSAVPPSSGTMPAVIAPVGSIAAPQLAHAVAPASIGSPHTPQ